MKRTILLVVVMILASYMANASSVSENDVVHTPRESIGSVR